MDPVKRTFNWPFLCAMVQHGGARVPEFSSRTVRNTQVAGQRQNKSVASRRAEATKTPAAKSDSDSEADQVLYTGDESGISRVSMADDDSASSDSSDDDESDEESDFDEYEDADTAHIETLVAITGSPAKYFDTVEWLRTLLFTLQMYIDVGCETFHMRSGQRHSVEDELIFSNATPIIGFEYFFRVTVRTITTRMRSRMPQPRRCWHRLLRALMEIRIRCYVLCLCPRLSLL